MRFTLVTLAVLSTAVPSLAADAGAPIAAATQDGGVRSSDALKAAQATMAQSHAQLLADHQAWVQEQASKDAGTDKGFAKLKSSQEQVIKKDEKVLAKHAEAIARHDKISQQLSEKKTSEKKAQGEYDKLAAQSQKLVAEHDALLAERYKLVGGRASVADAGAVADAGSPDAGTDAGAADAGGAGQDSGTPPIAVVDAGAAPAPVAPAPAKGCSAVDGASAWMLLGALLVIRRSRAEGCKLRRSR